MGKPPASQAPQAPSLGSKQPHLIDLDDRIPFAGPSSSSAASEPLLNKPSDFDALPSYDESEQQQVDNPPPFSAYVPAKRNPLSNIRSVIRDSHLSSDSEALYQHLQELAFDIPHPLVHLLGTHRGYRTVMRNNKSHTEEYTITDFSVTLSLYDFLSTYVASSGETCVQPGEITLVGADEKRHRGSRMKHPVRHGSSSSASAEDPKSLRDYCYEFTQGKNRWFHTFREFSLTKVVPVNTIYLRTHLERIIRSTNYRGHTEITFPVHGQTVTIVPATWVTTARYTRWRYLFYFTFLWIITWPILWLLTKRWSVVDAVFQTVPGYEEYWINQWDRVIATLVRGRREGTVTRGEMEGVKEAIARDDARASEGRARRARGEEEGVTEWIAGIVRGVADASESVQGGWGADESSWSGGIGTFSVGSSSSVRL